MLSLLKAAPFIKKNSVTLNEAYGQGKVKVESNDGRTVRYKNIKLHNGTFYGVKGKTETPLDMENITAIYLPDIFQSSNAKIAIFLMAIPVVIVAIIYIIFLVEWG